MPSHRRALPDADIASSCTQVNARETSSRLPNTAAASSASTAAGLVKQLNFHAMPGCGEQLGQVSVEFTRLPLDLVLRGWQVFQTEDGQIRIGVPLVLGGPAGSRFTAISGAEMPKLVTEIRAALLAQHPELTRGA